jgi:hypothetical protein
LYGKSGSLIDLTGQTVTTYGILVGSTVSGSDAYTGNMYIDESVTANISSGVGNDEYGVYFGSAAGLITINSNFSVSGNRSYGAYFGSVASGSTQNINGNFSIFASGAGGAMVLVFILDPLPPLPFKILAVTSQFLPMELP